MSTTDASKAYDLIKEKVIKIKMPPGSVIRETELMQELNLGRTPIREALKRLESENLVIVKPRQGIFVADIPITDLIQIFEVRVELESLCAYLASKRMTPQILTRMKDMAEVYSESDKQDLNFLFNQDQQFHMLLAEAAGNRFLVDEIDYYYNLSLRIWYLVLNNVKPADIDIDAHLKILHAIEKRDHEAARKHMRKHIEQFHRTIKSYV
ncbi:MAG: GntR family transcriptional regulator [Anaerolineales bacterium]|nr:GntR family transcriptional regulator [Anaerolineales bacterium]